MDITSRKKRPLDRTKGCFRDTRLVIIFAEGEKTEKQYFESDLFRSHRVQVKVLGTKDGYSAPKHVFERMKAYLKNVDLEPHDEYWLMTDVDRWPENQLAEVFSHAIRRKSQVGLAVSNPSFELWLFLHLADWSGGPCTASQVEAALRTALGSFNKSHLRIDDFRGKIDSAVKRARAMSESTSDRGLWPSNPGTHVFKAVESALRASMQASTP